MNRLLRLQLLCMAASSMVLMVVADNSSNSVVTNYRLRPQSLNSARKVAGEVPGSALVHLDKDEIYGYFGMTPEYDQTFRPRAIAQSLFGNCLTYTNTTTTGNNCKNSCQNTSLVIQGTGVANRAANALRAEDFYLPQDFDGALSFSPKISNFLIDFQFYLGFGEICGWGGTYMRLYAPFVHTKWDLHMSEQVVAKGTQVIAGSFASTAVTSANLLSSASQFFAGNTPTAIPSFPANATATFAEGDPGVWTIANQFTQNVVRNPLTVAKIVSGCTPATTTTNCTTRKNHSGQTKNGFGDIRAELGWNFWQCGDGHIGLNIQAAAPTGNRPDAEFLFAPVVGNQKHWELGGGLTAHYVWWRSCDENQHFGIYLDGMVTHLFNNTQTRVFDLNNKPLSRYMLAALHGAPQGAPVGLAASGTALQTTATTQFAQQFTPVANLTKQKVQVSVGAQGDVSLWLNYSACGFSFDLGYNFFGQTCEKISCQSKCPPRLKAETQWALKGDAHVYGFTGNGVNGLNNQPYALAVSESIATIVSPAVNNNQNTSVDNAQLASVLPGSNITLSLFDLPGATQNQTRLSLQPQFLTIKDINLQGKSRILTNKIFTHFQYKWNHDCWSPYLGIGGEVEFGNSNDSCNTACNTTTASSASCTSGSCPTTTTSSTNCKTSCSSCTRVGASQWGVWLKTGVAFN